MPHQAISFQSLFASLHHKLALLRIHSKVIIVCKNENALHLVLFLRSWNFVAISIRASAPIVNRIILHFRAPPGISSKSTVFFLNQFAGIEHFTPRKAPLSALFPLRNAASCKVSCQTCILSHLFPVPAFFRNFAS